MDFIKNLKVGDKVVVKQTMSPDSVDVVTDITPTGRVKVRDILFNTDGFPTGKHSYSAPCLMEATPERISQIIRDTYIRKLSKFDFTRMADEQLQRTWAIIKEVKEEEKTKKQ